MQHQHRLLTAALNTLEIFYYVYIERVLIIQANCELNKKACFI